MLSAHRVDSGKITLQVRDDQMPSHDVQALSVVLGQSLGAAGIGVVTAVAGVDHEPFAADSPWHGFRWNRIDLDLARDVALDTLVDLLILAGAPASSHLTYTVRMQLAGLSLSEARPDPTTPG